MIKLLTQFVKITKDVSKQFWLGDVNELKIGLDGL